VDVGVLEAECRQLLRAYAFHRVYGRPFTTVKLAQSLDGQIATSTGHSQWISGPESRTLAHQLRRENDAVLVGTGTALADNPQLNLRHVHGVNPQRILIDSRLKVPVDFRLFQAADRCKTYVATTAEAPQKKMELLKSMGVQVLQSRVGRDGRIHLPTLWNQLGALGITSVMVEGGGQLITSLLKRRLVNYYVAAIAPMIIGQGTPSVGDLYIEKIDQAIRLENVQRKFRGQDIILLADVAYADGKIPPPSLCKN
jgi:riboflavin-specific deaminase-like protein